MVEQHGLYKGTKERVHELPGGGSHCHGDELSFFYNSQLLHLGHGSCRKRGEEREREIAI